MPHRWFFFSFNCTNAFLLAVGKSSYYSYPLHPNTLFHYPQSIPVWSPKSLLLNIPYNGDIKKKKSFVWYEAFKRNNVCGLFPYYQKKKKIPWRFLMNITFKLKINTYIHESWIYLTQSVKCELRVSSRIWKLYWWSNVFSSSTNHTFEMIFSYFYVAM